jgi:hypothetical protein
VTRRISALTRDVRPRSHTITLFLDELDRIAARHA